MTNEYNDCQKRSPFKLQTCGIKNFFDRHQITFTSRLNNLCISAHETNIEFESDAKLFKPVCNLSTKFPYCLQNSQQKLVTTSNTKSFWFKKVRQQICLGNKFLKVSYLPLKMAQWHRDYVFFHLRQNNWQPIMGQRIVTGSSLGHPMISKSPPLLSSILIV
jgi:hypothetical protein